MSQRSHAVDQHLHALRADAVEVDRYESALEVARETRDARVLILLGMGVSERRIARAAGISPPRVNQIRAAARRHEAGMASR